VLSTRMAHTYMYSDSCYIYQLKRIKLVVWLAGKHVFKHDLYD